MARIYFTNSLNFIDGTGFDINPNTGLFAKEKETVTFSIGQDVSTTSNIFFNQLSATKVTIDDGNLILFNNDVTGSFTHTGNLTISSNFTNDKNLTIFGNLTAQKIEAEVTKSATIFESGSTIFGDTIDDEHFITGSVLISGSINLNNYSISEISNDTTLADSNENAYVTEYAVKTFIDDSIADIPSYIRKIFAHTGSFVSVSTASFTATSASAPSGYTATSEDDFMFFANGMIMEHDALNIQQSGSEFYLKVNSNSIGYDLKSSDEFVVWGKFNS